MKKESVYCFNIFYAFSFYAPLLKSGGGASAPPAPRVRRPCTICKSLHWLAQDPSSLNLVGSEAKSHTCHLSPKQHVRLSSLVGKKCIVKCKLNGLQASALWDTGSQVSLVSSNFVKENFPSLKLRNLTDLLDCGDILDLRAANDTPVPFDGFVELTFELAKASGEIF